MNIKKNYKFKDMDDQMMSIIIQRYEAKLIELMGHDKFMAFSKEIAKDLFFASIMKVKDSDFRNFCLDNYERITGAADAAALDFPNSMKGDAKDQ